MLGSEGKGLRRLTKESCDFLVKVETKYPEFSLNVAMAGSIALYELYKTLKRFNGAG